MKTRPVTSSVKKRPRPTKKAKSFKGKSKGSCGKLGTFTEPHLLPRALSKEYPVPKLSKTVIVSSKKNKVTTEKDKNILTSTPHYTKTRSDVFFNSADSSFFSPIDSVSKKKDEIKEQKATPVGSSKKNNDSVHREISFLKPKPPTTVISEKQNSSEKERSPEKKTGKEKSKRPHLAKKSKLVKTASQDKDRADHVVPDISSLTSPVSLENIKKPRGRPHLKPATSESTNVNDNNNKAHYDNLVVLISSQELTESPRKDTIDFVNKTPRRRASRGLPNQCNMCVDENLHEEEGIKSRLSPVPGVSESVSTPKKSRVKNRSENPVPAENSSGHAESPPGVYKNLTEETTAKMSPRVEAVNKGNNKAHTAAANDEGTGRSTMPEKSRVQDNSPHETSSQNNVGEIMSRSPVREAENQENNEAQQAAVINKDVPESVGTPQKPTVPAENSSGCPESPPRNYNNLMEEISARKVSAVKAASKGNNKAQIGVVPNNDVPESVGTPQKPTLKSRSENPVPVENSSGCPDSPPRNYNNLMEEIAARKASTVEAASKGNNKAQIGAVPNNEEPGCSTTSQRSRVLGPRKPSAKRVAEEPGSSTTSPRSRVQGPRKTPAKRAAGTKEDLFSMLYSKEELAKRKEKWENLFAEFERRHREHEEERAADFDRLSTTSSRSDWSWTSSELARKPKKPVPVVNKTRAERVESLHKVIEKIRRRTVNKEIQTSNVFSQNSASSRAPLYRRSSLIKAVQRSLAQGLTDRTDGLGEPNIFDSIQQDLDIFGFSAIELDISSLNRPWRFENGGEQSDNFTPSFIRPEAEIRYSDICNRSRVGDGESGENSPNKTLTQNDASPAISTASFNRLTRSNFRKQYVKKNRGLVDQDVSAPSRTKQKNVQEANVKLPIVDTSNIETSKDEEADINPPEPPRGNSNKNKSLDTVVQQPYPRTRSKTRIVASSNKGPMLNDYLQATQLQSKNKRHTKTKNKSLEEHVSLPATEDQSIRLKASQRLGNKQATLNSQQEEHAVSSESADVDLSNVADVSTKRPMLSDSLKATLNNASLPLQSKNKRLTKKKNESLEEQDQSIRLKASQRRENKQARPNSQQEEHAVSSESANIDLSIVANVSTKRKCTFEDREDEGFSKSGKLKTRRMQSKEKMKESNDRLESYDSPPSEEILGDKLDVSVQSTSNNLTKRNSSKGKRLTNSRNKQSTKKQKDSLEQVSLPAVEDQNIKLKTRRAQFNSRQDEHPSEERLGAAGTSAVPSQSKRKLRNNSRKKLRKVENSIVDEKENEHLGTSVQPSDTETSHIHLETANRSRSKKSTRRPRNTSYLREVTVSNILQNEGGVRPQRKRKVAPGLITLEEMASILSRPARRPKGEPLMKRRKRRQTRENSRTSKKRNVQRSAVPVPKPRIEGIFEEEEMAHNNSEYVHQQEIDDQPSTSRGIMHSPTRKSPNWLKPRRPKTSYEEPEFQKPSQSNKKQTTTTSRARRRLNKGNDNLNIANNSEEEHVHQQEIDAQPSTSRGIMHSPTRKSPSWSKTGRPKIPYEEPEFQKPSRGNKKQTTTTSRVSRPLNEGNDNMDIANNSDEGHSVFSIQPGPSREPGSIGGMNNGTFSRVLDRVSNMHRSFPSAPSHTGSELRNERDLDSNNEGPPDDECLKLPFGGNAYTVRFIIRRPPESAFRNLGNLHVCEMMKHPNTSYSTGFLKLGVDDLKRPSTGAKYSFVFYVVSGSGQILVNGKRQRVHNGDSFTVPMGISEISVYRIIKEYSSTSTVVVKKEYSRQRKVLDSVDEDTKRIVRGKVHNFFKKNEPPTVEKILKAVNDDARCPNFTHSTFYRLLKELNFCYQKRNRNGLLKEKDEIISWRRRYIRNIQAYRTQGKKIYYLDENG